jgi:hypothetical protein
LIVKLTCPKCQASGTMILRDAAYEGPYRCWKCSDLFTIRLADNRMESCTPMSHEDFLKWQETAALRAKMGKR